MKIMIALLFFFCYISFSLFAGEDIHPCEKTYITSDRIHLEESAFFVQVDDLWIQPAALHIDGNGIYFDTFRQIEPCPGPWQCQNRDCMCWNDYWRVNCKKCNFPKGTVRR